MSHLSRKIGYALLPLASAVMLAAAFPPWNVTLLAWVGLIPLGLTIRATPSGAVFYLAAAIAGSLFHLATVDWIRTSYHGVALSGARVVPWLLIGLFALPCLPALLGIGRRAQSRVALPLWMLLPILWVGYEFARLQYGAALQGAPLIGVQLGHTQTEHVRLIQLADLGGVWLITAVVAMVNGTLCDLGIAAWTSAGRAAMVRPVLAVTAVAAATWGYGAWRLAQQPSELGPHVCLMPAHSAAELTKPPTPPRSTEPSARPRFEMTKADLLVWSELVLDGALTPPRGSAGNPATDADNDLRDCLVRQAAACGTPLAVGLPRIDAAGRRYNSVAVVDPAGGTINCYDKLAIVPWSEFLPCWAARFVEDRTAGFSPGDRHCVFELGSGRLESVRYAVAICYDVCFPEVMKGFFTHAASPDFFVVAACESSDQTGTVPQWMLAMSRLRAIECRRAIVRNVEGGHSGLIDGNGRMADFLSAAEFQQPRLLPAVPIDRRVSLYRRLGDWLPISLLALSLLLCVYPPRDG